MYGRHGEAPLAILAPSTPADCFDIVIEAARIALKYRTPVIVLSDAFLATGSEPWKLPDGPPPGYPERIVDHAVERKVALARYAGIR